MVSVENVVEEIKRAFPQLQIDQEVDDVRTLLYLDNKIITAEISHEDDVVQDITVDLKMYFNAYSETWSNDDDLSESLQDHKTCISAIQYLYNLTDILPDITDETEHHDDTQGFYTISYTFKEVEQKNEENIEPQDVLDGFYLTAHIVVGETKRTLLAIIQALLDTGSYCIAHFSKCQYDEQMFERGYQNFGHILQTFIDTEKKYKEYYEII